MIIKIARNGKILGDFHIADLRLRLHDGTVLPTDHYWVEGMANWELVSSRSAWDDDVPPAPAVSAPIHTYTQQPLRPAAAPSGIPLFVKIIGGFFGGVAALGILAAILFPVLQSSGIGDLGSEEAYDHSKAILFKLDKSFPAAQFPDFTVDRSDIKIRKMRDGSTSLVIVDSWLSVLGPDGQQVRKDWSVMYISSSYSSDGEIVYVRVGSTFLKGDAEDGEGMIRAAEDGQLDELARMAHNINRRDR